MEHKSKHNLTEKELNTLADFGKEEDGSYCDRWQFSIIKYGNGYAFYLFNEVDGSNRFIKKLKDFDDLKNVYKAITDKELEITTKETEQDKLIKFFETISASKEEDDFEYCRDGQTEKDVLWYREHYHIPDSFDWDGNFVQGISVWKNSVFLFDTNGKFFGRAINNLYEYVFDNGILKNVMGPTNYNKYIKL